jgi:hypothetical protein
VPIENKDHPGEDAEQGKRLSMDGTATVNIGACARGGQPRGAHNARAHDLGGKEHYIPCGIVDEATAQLYVTCGSSSKTSDGIVETLAAGWQGLSAKEPGEIERVPIQLDNGSERSGVRTPFLPRLVPLVETIGTPLHLLSDPPYPSTYNPIERCWGMMAWHGHGAQLIDVETMREWAKRMTWKGVHPVVELSRKVYAKGVSLSKAARRAVEAR